MSITLAQIRTQAKRRADMENGSFVSDAEWLDYINASIAELHDILVTIYEDYYISETTLNTVAGTTNYALPSDFYKLKGLDAQFDSGTWETVKKYQFQRRNSKQDVSDNVLKYRILGSNISFVPVPQSVIAMRVYYIPVATKLALDADELDDLNQFSEYIVVDAAIKALLKEESDAQGLMMQKEALRRRIESAAPTRDENESEGITDVHSITWDID